MRQSRFTEEQIIGILKEGEPRLRVGEICRKQLAPSQANDCPRLLMIDPVSYLDMLMLEKKRQGNPDRFGGRTEGGVLAASALYYPARRDRMGGDSAGRLERSRRDRPSKNRDCG